MTETECNPAPIFLVAAERSGTTMLRLMLDHHPEIAFFSEFEFAIDRISDSGNFPDVDSYREWLANDRVFLDSGFRIDPALGYPELVRSFLEQKRDRDRKPLLGATVHRGIDRLGSIWSDARYIHLLRDPRDVARSTIAMGWAGNVWTGVERWIEAESEWSRLRDDLPRDRWVELRYESLVQDPEGQLQTICEFLGVRYDAQMLAYPATTTYPPPDPRVASRWRQTLSEEELGLVEQRVGSRLAECGYSPSGAPAVVVTPRMEHQLRRQDQFARVRFRIRQYGLFLFAAEYLSRKLGLDSLHAPLLHRMHDVTRRHLR
jgi:hypothetical protein